jgi:hypothetical protein
VELTTLPPSTSRLSNNVGSLTSHNPIGLQGLLMGIALLYFTFISIVRIIKSRRMRWAGHVACMGEKRNANRLLVGKPERKRPLG